MKVNFDNVQLMDQIMSVVDDNKHPVFNFACGNKKSLNHTNVTAEAKEFYDKNYFMSEVILVTLGDNSKTDFGKVKELLQNYSHNCSMSKVRPPDNPKVLIGAPKIEQDHLFFSSKSNKPSLTVEVYLDVEDKNHRDAVKFLSQVIGKLVKSHLVDDLQIATDSYHGVVFQDMFADLTVSVDLNEKGRKYPAEALAAIIDCMKTAGSLATEAEFNKVKHELRAEMLLMTIPDGKDAANIAAHIGPNYRSEGLSKIFGGSRQLGTFDYSTVQNYFSKIVSAKRIIVLNGAFDIDENASNDLLDFFKKSPASDPDLELDSNNPSLYKLNVKSKLLNSPFAYFKIPSTFTEELLDRMVRDSRDITNKPKMYKDNPFVPTEKYLDELSKFKPSFKTAVAPIAIGTSQNRLEDKYEIPMVAVMVLFNFEELEGKRARFVSEFFIQLASKKLDPLNDLISAFRSSVSLSIRDEGIQLKITALPLYLNDVLKQGLDLISFNTTTQKEREDALTDLLKSVRSMRKIYRQAEERLDEWLRPDQLSLDEWEAFGKEEETNGYSTLSTVAKLTLSHLYIERSNDEINEGDILQYFKDFKVGRFGLTKGSARDLEQATIVINNTQRGEGMSEPERGYQSCTYWGENNGENFATIRLTRSLTRNYADRIFRVDLRIGYAILTDAMIKGKDLFLCVAIQGEKPSDYIHEQVEKYWKLLIQKMTDLPDETFSSVKDSVIQRYSNPFLNRDESSNFFFNSLLYNTEENYYPKMINVLQKTTKKDIVDLLSLSRPRIVSIVEGLP